MYRFIKKIIPISLKRKILLSLANHPEVIQKVLRDNQINQERLKYITANEGLQKLIADYEFISILDIGSGEGVHSRIFMENGKQVTSLDYGESIYYKKNDDNHATIICDYYEYSPEFKFDCIWASHVLEHQPNPNLFLKKIFDDLTDTGVLAITVPPLKNQIVGGHVNLYNAGMLLYQLILAGFDCSNAAVASYGYNITVIVKKSVPVKLDKITFDSGDIQTLKRYFPMPVQSIIGDADTFDGVLSYINW